MGLWTAAGAVSIAAGPIVGGLLIAAFGWRSIFWVNVPLCVAGIVATYAWIADKKPEQQAQARGIDLPGQILATVALTGFVGAMIELRPLGLTHPLVIGGIAVALLAAVALVLVERRASAPMLPPALFRNRTFNSATVFGICVNLTYYGMVFVLSLYPAARAWPYPFGNRARVPAAHRGVPVIESREWRSRRALRLALADDRWRVDRCSRFAALLFVNASTPVVALLLPFLLIPTGMGLAVPAMTTAVLGTVAPDRAGTASAVLNTARQAAGAIGVAAFGALASHSAMAESAQIVTGVKASAGVSVALLLFAAVLAWRAVETSTQRTIKPRRRYRLNVARGRATERDASAQRAPGTLVASGLIHALLVQRAVRRPLVRNRTCPRRRRTPPTCRSNPIPMNCSTPIHRRLRTIPTPPMVRIQQRRWYLQIRTTVHRVFDFAVPDQQKNARLCLAGGHFFGWALWSFLAFFGPMTRKSKGRCQDFARCERSFNQPFLLCLAHGFSDERFRRFDLGLDRADDP